ncbi:MAG: ATP-binding protein, partial [Bacteroidia bacterium]
VNGSVVTANQISNSFNTTHYHDSKKKLCEELSDDWFKSHIETSIADLGHRYTQELNVELYIAKNFDAISRNERFYENLRNEVHQFLKEFKRVDSYFLNKIEVKEFINLLIYQVDGFEKSELLNIDIESIDKHSKIIGKLLYDYENIVRNENTELSQDSIKHTIYTINKAQDALYYFNEFMAMPLLSLANKPIMILLGEAGIGKSHLLADIANKRINENKACILLLGQQFSSEESPWTQIINHLLRLKCNEHEFLDALNAKAETQGERLLFMVDAINEGKGRYFWESHIKGFINAFSKYPWLGLILSIRSSYEDLLTPKELISEDMAIRIIHHGFENVEYQASSFFFSQYSIQQPSIPLLHPEFSNPLFLKLFCEGLSHPGYKSIPKGYSGITAIIDFFLDSVDKKLSAPKFFDYPSGRHIVRRIIDNLIKSKLENNCTSFISYEEAYKITDEFLSKFNNKRGFLEALISEGVLSKNLFWIKEDKYEEGIYFAYERFEDHFTVAYLLENSFDKENPETAFQKGGSLEPYVQSYRYQGIIEALSIQLPERIDKELYELISDDRKSSHSIVEPFIKSLIWRKPETIKEKVKDYVNEHILHDEHGFNLFMQMVYSVSSDPEHFFNADWLHHYLMHFSLADRDAIWTTYLHDKNYQGSAMQRLIDWALQDEDKSYLSDESRLLACKALAWLFTSTNISFRDSATKALVCLLENQVSIIWRLLVDTHNINDPYVQERIFAVAYGSVLRSNDLQGLDNLSQYILEKIFEQEEVYPNVLVRDYARNIIEYALYKKVFGIENHDTIKHIIRPPYNSDFPDSFPSNEEIDAHKSSNYSDPYWGKNRILSSMVTEYGRGICSYGDFGRYTFGAKVRAWDQFNDNDLSNYACKLIFEKYGYDAEKHGKFDRYANDGDRHTNTKERIGKKYQWIALYEVLARLSDNYQMSEGYGENKEYSWYQGTFEPFVRNIDPTVVNKLKQNKTNKEECWWNKLEYTEWNGSHQEWLISANNLPDTKKIIELKDNHGNEWLVLETYPAWDEDVPVGYEQYDYPHKHLWYQIKSYFVRNEDAESLIAWAKKQHFMGRWLPENHDEYQVFSREYYWSPAYHFFDDPYYGRSQWEEVHEKNHPKNLTEEIKFLIKNYSVTLFDELIAITDVDEKDFSDNELLSTIKNYPPELLKKLESTIKEGNNPPEEKLIGEVMVTTESHIWESGTNQEEQPSYLSPRQYMYEKMQLQYSQNMGEWLNSQGEVICFDPSVNTNTPSCLLVRKDALLKFLADNNLKIFWTCLGEKQIRGIDDYNKFNISEWLELSGVFTFLSNNIEGEINPRSRD